MSFAIIETGGKQYKVSASKILEIEKLNAKVGETIKFNNVLLLNDDKNTEIGSPKIDGATVEAKLLDNVKDRTVLIFHKRRRKHSRKKNGHRQRHSKIQITPIITKISIVGGTKLEKGIIAFFFCVPRPPENQPLNDHKSANFRARDFSFWI